MGQMATDVVNANVTTSHISISVINQIKTSYSK